MSNKEKRVTVLFDEETYNELVADAKKVGLSQSGYVRLMYGYAKEYIRNVVPTGAKLADQHNRKTQEEKK